MINLVPNEEKKVMKQSFYYRLSTIFFVALGCCMLIASIALIPAYVSSMEKKSSLNNKLEIQKTENIDAKGAEVTGIIDNLDKKITLVEQTEKNKFSVSEKIIKEILSHKIPQVKITEISFNSTVKDGRKVSVSGLASSREQLFLFRKSLEEDPAFKMVDLPISNFVKGSNIKFSLTLLPS